MSQDYWENVYSRHNTDSVSWFQQQASMSLQLLKRYTTLENATVIDVGGGASPLVDTLISYCVKTVTVLDLAESALATSKQRLAERADLVDWQVGDILQHPLPLAHYDIWHDRAVFHFMTQDNQREAYRTQLIRALKPGGIFVIGTFAADGPEKCSGLPVCRYNESLLVQQFSSDFLPLRVEYETHQTPSGNAQSFIWGCFAKK